MGAFQARSYFGTRPSTLHGCALCGVEVLKPESDGKPSLGREVTLGVEQHVHPSAGGVAMKLRGWRALLEKEPHVTSKDRQEFRLYCRACTDAQLGHVFHKENKAGRDDYAEIARGEALRRGMEVDNDWYNGT